MSTGLPGRQCATHSSTQRLVGSKSRFTTTSASCGCEYAMMEKASTRRLWPKRGAPVTGACAACMKGPNAWALIWESGVSPILARRLNLPFPAPLRTPHLLKAVRGYPEKVKSQVISVAHTHLRYFFQHLSNCTKIVQRGQFGNLLSPVPPAIDHCARGRFIQPSRVSWRN